MRSYMDMETQCDATRRHHGALDWSGSDRAPDLHLRCIWSVSMPLVYMVSTWWWTHMVTTSVVTHGAVQQDCTHVHTTVW